MGRGLNCCQKQFLARRGGWPAGDWRVLQSSAAMSRDVRSGRCAKPGILQFPP